MNEQESDKKKKKKVRNIPLEDVSVVSRLAHLIHFRDAATPLGHCRKRTLNSLRNLLDSSYPDSNNVEDAETPQNALGPILEAVTEWITEPSMRHKNLSEKHNNYDKNQRRKGPEKDHKQSNHNDRRKEIEIERLRKKEIERQELKEKENVRNNLKNIPERNSREQGEASQGLLGALLGAAYNAGINLISGNFSALSGEEVESSSFIILFLLYSRTSIHYNLVMFLEYFEYFLCCQRGHFH